MKQIVLQAGHGGITSGATGAPGEQKGTTTIVPMIAKLLEDAGVVVYQTGSKANEDPKVVETDWDIFLAVHYDADIYNDSGGFVDFADPTTDLATKESQRMAAVLAETYFDRTGIKNMPKRSNANTRGYYMWSYLTPKTPCVIIECGVGNRKPRDYEILHNEMGRVASAISDGLLIALGVKNACTDQIEALEIELDAMRESRNGWKKTAKDTEDLLVVATENLEIALAKIVVLEKSLSENVTPLNAKKDGKFIYETRALFNEIFRRWGGGN